MVPKCFLTLVPDAAPDLAPVAMTLGLTKRFEGYAECVVLRSEDSSMSHLSGGTGSAYQIEAARAASERHAQRQAEAVERFREDVRRTASRMGIKVNADPGSADDHNAGPVAVVREMPQRDSQATARLAQAFDLIVTSTANEYMSTQRQVAEAALLTSGRPVLLAPASPPDETGRRIVIGWDGSREAWHAVTTALPFLEAAESVTIGHVGNGERAERLEHALQEYLAVHGVDATMRTMPSAGGVAPTLFSMCTEEGADLLVMGGYSHGRLREAVFGGPTRYVLSHAAPVSVLMVH